MMPKSHISINPSAASADPWRRVCSRIRLIILTSDHGESLGEHGEETHGYFIYESTLRVPLIFHWPDGAGPYPARRGRARQPGGRSSGSARISGYHGPTQFQGHSLLRMFGRRSPPDEPVYGESMYARDHLGCSPLRSVRVGGYKYIEAPKPELYDLNVDPHETQNLYDRERKIGARVAIPPPIASTH